VWLSAVHVYVDESVSVCSYLCRFPFYYVLKLCFILWLVLPATKGSSLLYRKVVHPQLCNREKVGINLSRVSVYLFQHMPRIL